VPLYSRMLLTLHFVPLERAFLTILEREIAARRARACTAVQLYRCTGGTVIRLIWTAPARRGPSAAGPGARSSAPDQH
jgi:hypothetical protein